MTQEFDIARLTPAECIQLAELLWEQARTHPKAVPITSARLEELNHRPDAFESGTMRPGEPWEDVDCWLETL
jgi:putative addiction module component (TIGR02574 family)